MSKLTIADSIQEEIDRIFMLSTYTLVYRDWQGDSIPRQARRGYNIGALLVDPDNIPMYHGLNCINSTDNATQHSEVRAIMGYLDQYRGFNLDGFSIYVSLEPCVMCAGIITMTAVQRAVYGQKDVTYSKAFERLAIQTPELPPYPRQVQAKAAEISYRWQLDAAYQEYMATHEEKILAKFLASDKAREIFQAAAQAFDSFQVCHPANEPILQAAKEYLSKA